MGNISYWWSSMCEWSYRNRVPANCLLVLIVLVWVFLLVLVGVGQNVVAPYAWWAVIEIIPLSLIGLHEIMATHHRHVLDEQAREHDRQENARNSRRTLG